MINSLFINLSRRLRNENDLSDITWAMCETSKEFQKVFLSFFFGEKVDFSFLDDFIREYSSDDSRPDFWLSKDRVEFLIEVKIYNRNQHFGKYESQFCNIKKKGFIANYHLSPKEILNNKGWIIKTWEEYSKYLQTKINEKIFSNDSIPLIEGYLQYLKNVCSLININKMKLNNLSSLSDFNTLVEKIIETPFNEFSGELYNKSTGFCENRSGKYFRFVNNKTNTEIYPWFGIYYDTEKVIIYIEFHGSSDNCKPVYDKILQKIKKKISINGNYFSKPYQDTDFGPCICFELKKDYFSLINNEKTTVEKQKEILSLFYKEVLTYASKFF